MYSQIVDATLVPAPKQRNPDGEKEAIRRAIVKNAIYTMNYRVLACTKPIEAYR